MKITTKFSWNIIGLLALILSLVISKEDYLQMIIIGILCCITGFISEIAENTKK